MATPFAMIRGRVIRVTRLLPTGELHPSGDHVVTRTVARVGVVEKTYSHADGIETNSRDRVVLVPHEYEEIVGYTVDLSLLEADPDVLNIVSGNAAVEDENLDVVGFAADSHVYPPTFALEVWSRLASPCENGRLWGYTLFPRLSGGRLSGLEVSGEVSRFEIVGASCLRAPVWEPCDPRGFGFDGFGEMPFGDDVNYTCGGLGFGLGPFSVSPFDAPDSPLSQVITHNRFWMTQTVQGVPGPYRSIAALESA